MANAGITFDFAAESAKLRGEIDKVRKELSTINATAKSVEKGFKLVGGALIGAFSVSKIVGFLSTINAAADQLNDLSGRLNAGAGDLQVLQIAAQQAGGSADAMSTALAKMSVSLGSALSGSKPVNDALAQLGLTARNLASLKTDEAMQRIGTALSGVSNDYQRAAIAQTIFGKGSAELAALFREFPELTNGVNARLEEMGAKIDKIDVAKIGVMNDELAFQKTAIGNLATGFLADLSPAVMVASNSISNIIASIGGATQSGELFGTVMTGAVKLIEAAVQGLISWFELWRGIGAKLFEGLTWGASKALESMASLADFMGLDVADSLRSSAKAAAGWSEQFRIGADAAFASAARAKNAAIAAGADVLNANRVFQDAASALQAEAEKAAARANNRRGGYDPSAGGGAGAAENPFANGSRRTDDIRLETVKDPFTDPKYLYQQQLGTALAELAADQSAEQFGIQQVAQQSILDSLLLNNEYLIAAEQAKNVTLGASLTELAGVAIQQGGVLGKFGKAYAIAQTIWSTGTAIMNAMAQVPWPANIAVAAGMAAKGAMQLANIRKTSIGSGGSVLSSGTGGATAPALPDRIGATAPAEDTRTNAVQIILNGPVSGPDSVRWIAEEIGNLVNGNDLVFINGGSRQAMELRT